MGYALDGFPILSPLMCADHDCANTVTVRSGYQQVSTARMVWSRYGYVEGLGNLDRCNGMTGPDGEIAGLRRKHIPLIFGLIYG